MLFEDVVEEGGHGDEDRGGGDPEGGGLADGGVLGLDLVGLHVEDIVLLEVIIGGADEVGIVKAQREDLLFAIRILTDQLDIIAHTVDGQVTGLGQRLEDIDLLIADGEHTGTVDLTQDRDLVVRHANRDHRVLIDIQVRHDLVVN